jgi:hypothetical protein
LSDSEVQLPSPPAAPAETALLCLRCRYTLHGLAEDGLCPECALPIRASREGTPLHHYPAQWLDRVAQGVTLLAVGIWANAALRLALLLHVITYTVDVPAGDFPTARAAEIVIDILIFIANWMAAAPQPQAHERAVSTRRLVRLAAAVMLALDLLLYVGLVKKGAEKAAWYSASYTVEIAQVALLTIYLRRLAAFLGRPGLALQLSLAFIGWAASVAVGSAMFWIADLLRLTLWRHLHLPTPAPLAKAAWWPFVLYFGVVLLQFRYAFQKAARGRE